MSPPGENFPIFQKDPTPSSTTTASAVEGSQNSALPLRLSVSQGGLGIELSRPLFLGPLEVDALEVSLLGVKYPVDLSKGVKQFRSRRSRLVSAQVSVDLTMLSRSWEKRLSESWGEPWTVRVRPVFMQSGEFDGRDGEQPVEALSLTLLSQREGSTDQEALAFDLVVASGSRPCFVVDAARLWGTLAGGQRQSAMHLAFRAIDACLGDGQSLLSVERAGRVVEVSGMAEGLALSIFPMLGCRMPLVDGPTLEGLWAGGGRLRIELGTYGDPFPTGRRAMRARSAASIVREGDHELGKGRTFEARNAYLEALQTAPGHPEVLLELAELDLADGRRGESALAFLEELEAGVTLPSSAPNLVRRAVSWSRALFQTGRSDAARDALTRAHQLEPDATLGALYCLELSRFVSGEEESRALLDRAVERAPFLDTVRKARLNSALSLGDFRTVAADAEHLEAAQATADGRARVCMEVGQAFFGVGREEEARAWFRRALRLRPDDPEVQLALARGLARSGESFRAAELMSSALHGMETELELTPKSEKADVERHRRLGVLSAEAHFDLARILLESDENVPAAIAHLARVPMRSDRGVSARLEEARLHQQSGRPQHRDRALFRLLEALELKWVDPEGLSERLQPFFDLVAKDGDRSLISFGRRLLRAQPNDHPKETPREKGPAEKARTDEATGRGSGGQPGDGGSAGDSSGEDQPGKGEPSEDQSEGQRKDQPTR